MPVSETRLAMFESNVNSQDGKTFAVYRLCRPAFESNVNSQDGKTGIEALRRVFKFESNVNSLDGKTSHRYVIYRKYDYGVR